MGGCGGRGRWWRSGGGRANAWRRGRRTGRRREAAAAGSPEPAHHTTPYPSHPLLLLASPFRTLSPLPPLTFRRTMKGGGGGEKRERRLGMMATRTDGRKRWGREERRRRDNREVWRSHRRCRVAEEAPLWTLLLPPLIHQPPPCSFHRYPSQLPHASSLHTRSVHAKIPEKPHGTHYRAPHEATAPCKMLSTLPGQLIPVGSTRLMTATVTWGPRKGRNSDYEGVEVLSQSGWQEKTS